MLLFLFFGPLIHLFLLLLFEFHLSIHLHITLVLKFDCYHPIFSNGSVYFFLILNSAMVIQFWTVHFSNVCLLWTCSTYKSIKMLDISTSSLIMVRHILLSIHRMNWLFYYQYIFPHVTKKRCTFLLKSNRITLVKSFFFSLRTISAFRSCFSKLYLIIFTVHESPFYDHKLPSL